MSDRRYQLQPITNQPEKPIFYVCVSATSTGGMRYEQGRAGAYHYRGRGRYRIEGKSAVCYVYPANTSERFGLTRSGARRAAIAFMENCAQFWRWPGEE